MPTPKEGYFLKDGVTKVPGTTTICTAYKDSGGLLHWAWTQGKEGLDYRETRDKAGDIGTLVHAAIEAALAGNPLPGTFCEGDASYDEVPARAYGAFLKWQKQTKIEILNQEMLLVSEEYRYGGTPDAVGVVDGKLVLLDWKTSKGVYKNYILQLAAYKQLWDENHPDTPITGGTWLVRFSKTDGVCEPYFFEDLTPAWEQFKDARRMYEREKTLDAMLERAKSCMKPL